MGNGPSSGRRSAASSRVSSEVSSEGISRTQASRVFSLSFGLVALFAVASVLLGLNFHRHAASANAQLPTSPISTSGSLRRSNAYSKPDPQAILGQLPLIFEPNQGQADPQVRFLAQGAGYRLFLDSTGATLGMQVAPRSTSRSGEHFVHMKLVGSSPDAVSSGTGILPGKSNYFIGNDPSRWRRGIPQFSGVKYEGVYPGIDLVFYGKQGHLEYDFKVAPGADASQAVMQFDGATRMELSGGDLILTGADEGGLRLHAPQIYQHDGDRLQPVAGAFVLQAANRVGFEIGPYDRSRELVIDPVPQFSTYFGGSGSETSPSVAVNGNGNIYLAGSTTSSTGFPVAGALLPPSALPNIFVAEISPSQPAVVTHLTFLGGSGADSTIGLAVDGGGNAYIVGKTTSTNFPTSGSPYQTGPETKTNCTGFPTCNSIFVSELNPLGSGLLYSSYLSGNGDDEATGMTIDSNRDVFITGTTTSVEQAKDQFPATQLPQPYQAAPKAPIQFFVTEVNTNIPGPSSVAYSTYFGGVAVAGGTVAVGGGIAVDTTGNVYFSGTTNFYNSGESQAGSGSGNGSDFPIVNAYQPCLDTPPPTSVVFPLSCSPPTLPPPPAPQTYPTDAFVAKINPNNAQTGTAQLLFATYFGGGVTTTPASLGMDTSTGIAIDPGGAGTANIYITGSTNSININLPTGSESFQGCLDNPGQVVTTTASCVYTNGSTNTDAYVARFSNPAVSTGGGTQISVGLTYFSYLGGAGNDSGAAIAVDTANDAFVTGTTNSTDFPVTAGAIQSVLAGTQNAFFAHIDTTETVGTTTNVGTYSTYFGGNGVDRGSSIAVDTISQNAYFAGDTTSSSSFPTLIDAVQTTLNGPSDAFVAELVPTADVTVVPTVSTVQGASVGNPLTISFTVTNDGPDLATGVFVNGTVTTGVTFTSGTASGGSCSSAVNNSLVCSIPTLQAGSTSTVSFSVTPTQQGTFAATAEVIKINNTNTAITSSAQAIAGSFNMAISPSSRTVAAGQTAQYTVQLNPLGAFANSVSLSVSGLPSASSFSFTSSSITFNGSSSASTVLNLTTTPQPVAIITATDFSENRGRPFYAFWLMIPGIALFSLGSGSRRSKRWFGLLALLLASGLILVLPSCSSGNKTQPPASGTPSGTYTMTVTATSGSFSTSKTFQVTVTP
jgi:hypothetical protein